MFSRAFNVIVRNTIIYFVAFSSSSSFQPTVLFLHIFTALWRNICRLCRIKILFHYTWNWLAVHSVARINWNIIYYTLENNQECGGIIFYNPHSIHKRIIILEIFYCLFFLKNISQIADTKSSKIEKIFELFTNTTFLFHKYEIWESIC